MDFRNRIVARVHRHCANMTRDAALMLRSKLAALRREWRHAELTEQHGDAYEIGIRFWRNLCSHRLANEFRSSVAVRNSTRALSTLLALLRYYPPRLLSVSLSGHCKISEASARKPFASEYRAIQATPLKSVHLGDLSRLTPVSTAWGYDRGRPVDRYYIEKFLAQYAHNIHGHVLEIGDNFYTTAFGSERVVTSDVLHVAEGNSMATIVADLTSAPHVPSDSFDCIILTQTLQLIYDVRAAISTIYRILKPGGVLLATFPGISHIGHDAWAGSWYWNFTALSARRLFQETFPEESVTVDCYGNVLVAIAFLHGLAAEDLRQEDFDYHDPAYELVISVRAVKA